MRRAAKVDANQESIVKALRTVGASVQSLAAIGNGVPDLLVGFRGQTWLMEIKDGAKIPSRQQLTDDQIKWHSNWQGGTLAVINSTDAALKLIGAISD
jgi:hypothetical protein